MTYTWDMMEKGNRDGKEYAEIKMMHQVLFIVDKKQIA